MSVELNRDVIEALKRLYAETSKAAKKPPKTKPGSSTGNVFQAENAGAASNTAQVGDTVELGSAKGTEPSKQQSEIKQTAAQLSDGAVELQKMLNEKTETYQNTEALYFKHKSNGDSKHVAVEKAYLVSVEQANKTADFLEEAFEKNPNLRGELQSHFAELNPEIQKGLILDFERRAMKDPKGAKQEAKILLNGLKNSKFEVKSFACMRLHPHCSAEEFQRFTDQLKNNQANNEAEAVTATRNLTAGGTKEGGNIAISCAVNAKPEHQAPMIECIANSECAHNHKEIRTKLNNSLSKLNQKAQPEAAKGILYSKYFTEDDRNDTISQFKKFKTPEAQRKAAQYADECELMTTRNRKFLVSQIKLLHQSIQASVMQRMMQNQLNTNNKEVMNSITNEVPNLKIDDKAKNDILTALKNSGKVPEATIKQVEKILTEQAAAHKNINSAGSDKYSAQVKAQVELQSRLYAATGNNELSHLIASGTLSSKSQSLTQFVDLLDRRTITPELVIAAGHKNVLKSNFIALTKDSQEKVFDMLTADEVSEMWDKGQIPKRFEDKVMAKLSKNMTTSVASTLARTGSFTELVNFSQQAIAQKHINIFKAAIQERYSNRLPDLGNGMFA